MFYPAVIYLQFFIVYFQTTHNKVQQKLKALIKKWSEDEFKSDPALE